MYFIKSGIYTVSFKPPSKGFTMQQEMQSMREEVKKLKVGDHFGEIGLIYGCKRTATIKSDNYGQLAMLKKSDLMEL